MTTTVIHRHRRRSRPLHPRLVAAADEQLLELLLLYTATSRKPSPRSGFGQAMLVAVTASLLIYLVLAFCAYEVFTLVR